jgi:hypothetical protein
VQRQLSQIVALQRQDVEGVELNLVIMPARVQPIEIGNAVDAMQDRLAIDDERSCAVSQRGLDDQRVTIAPVIAVSGEQPNALALALDDQAIAVVLDLMKPVRPGRNLLPRVGMQGSYSYWRMAPTYIALAEIWSPVSRSHAVRVERVAGGASS